MYVIKDSNDVTVAICSRPEDAQAWVETKVDKISYYVEKQGLDDQAKSIKMNEGIKKT